MTRRARRLTGIHGLCQQSLLNTQRAALDENDTFALPEGRAGEGAAHQMQAFPAGGELLLLHQDGVEDAVMQVGGCNLP